MAKTSKRHAVPKEPIATPPGKNASHGPAPEPRNDALEGEGSYSATERYNAGVQKTVESGRVEELAKRARRAVDHDDADELGQARRAASHGHSVRSNSGVGHR